MKTQSTDDEDEDGIRRPQKKSEDLKRKGYRVENITRENFLDGHKVDYVKNRVAFDLEWNWQRSDIRSGSLRISRLS